MPITARHLVNTPLALAMLLPIAAPALAQPAADRVWIGPMPFIEARTLRPDYYPTLVDETKWPTVLARADVFKSYIMVLPRDPVAGKPGPELSDEELGRLVQFTREHGLKVAFEVGGIRMGPDTPNDQAGEQTAQSELRHLRRWLDAGGSIDYITTDHGVMLTIGAPYVAPDQHKGRGMTLAQAAEELTDYFEIIHREIPGARLGVIESLGFFEVDGPDGRHYPRTVPALPKWPFAEYLDTLLSAMKSRGLELDHFHIDFGYEGVLHDGGGQKLDFGRILGVEACAQQRGVKAGVIINAFHDGSVKDPQPDVASREAYEHTTRFATEYKAAGGNADHLVIQTWQPYPDKTGPESEACTVLGVAKGVLDGWAREE